MATNVKKLCRVTRDNLYSFDCEGYLLPHIRVMERRLKPATDPQGRLVPLVLPEEWIVVARGLFGPYGRFIDGEEVPQDRKEFRVLTIDASKVDCLDMHPHPYLQKGEFFGKVPRSAVVRDEKYSWVKDNSELEPIFMGFLSQNEMFRKSIENSRGYSPRRVA